MPNDVIGKYVYAYVVDGVIRYIGKGTGDRVGRHVGIARRRAQRMASGQKVRPHYFYGKLSAALERGVDVRFAILLSGISTDEEANRIEAALIARYGRERFDEGGVLWNLTEGGDGFTSATSRALLADLKIRDAMGADKRGRKLSAEHRRRISDGCKRSHADPAVKEKLRRPRVKPRSAEAREKLSSALKGKPKSPEHKAKLAEARRGKKYTAEQRAALSEVRKAYCSTEAGVAHMRKASAAAHARRDGGRHAE